MRVILLALCPIFEVSLESVGKMLKIAEMISMSINKMQISVESAPDPKDKEKAVSGLY